MPDAECEFRYQPDGMEQGIPVRGPALRESHARKWKPEETEQYQLFETSQYKYRVFVTDMSDPIYFVVWFYNQRGGAENLIKEANNDAGLAAHPSGRFDVNGNHFQLAMLAYNLNCWLMLFNREPQADATELRHTTLATSRLRFLFVAAKIWRHAGRTGVSYSDHYEEKGVFERLMDRLRRIVPRGQGYAPVMHAGPALNGLPPGSPALCIEIYARPASATEQVTSARGLAGADSREGDGAAKTELTYSTTSASAERDQRSER